MGLFSANYSKAGPGVAKDAPQKRAFFHFWEIYFRKFWKLLSLNIVYFLLCIPIITIGPATAAITKVVRNYSQEKHAFTWSDFFESFKKNFKQSLPVGLLDVFVTISLIAGFNLYPSLATGNALYYVPYVISISVALTLVMMHFYIYLMIVTVNLPLKNIFKNSFILTCLGIKKNIITLLAVAAVIGGIFLLSMYVSVLFLLLYPLVAFSLVQLIICYNSYPLIQKYIINPYYENSDEENPETRYLKSPDNEEAVFEDKGGTETPINVKNSSRGRTIQ